MIEPRRDTAETRPSTPEADLEDLFAAYVALCNRAVALHRHRLWFQPVKRVTTALCGGANFRAIVYDRRPRTPLAEFFLRFDSHDQTLEILPPGRHEVAFTWMAPVAYLREVVLAEPERYIENPLLLDWRWIQARAREEAAKRVDGQLLTLALLLGAMTALRRRRHTDRA
jgi:plasmid stabilization system protein ParE